MQVISIAGAMMVLTAFAALQLERMRAETYAYQLLNLCGGTMLVAAAITTGQAGLILMEGSWAVISLYGLVKLIRKS